MDFTASTSMDEDGIGPGNVHDGVERSHILQPKHKIFLSHSGAQKSFVADLCADLKRRDRHPFFDKLRSSLPIGEKFPGLIFEAIEQCQVGVVVLSEEFFTRSKWPMLELVAMVAESKKPNRRIKIIPVFYSISRNRCRDPAVQGEWMTTHWKTWEKQDARRIDVGKWRSALGILGSTNGLVMESGMLDGELRAAIVESICEEVLSETRWDDSGVEGKTRLCNEILKNIKGVQPLRGGVQRVGLYGMGGIGKTTACKMLCNDLSREYCDKVCHVELGSLDEVELYKKVLDVLFDLDVARLEKVDVGVCRGYLKNRIVKSRVFLALDNVSDESKEQAKSILSANFGDGSVVLVTARSMVQLQRLGIKAEDCFAMPELEHEEAKSLFLGYAGMQENELDEGFLEKCVRRCYFSKSGLPWSDDDGHYHPLALRVLGSEVGDELRYDARRQERLLRKIQTFNLSRQKEHPVFSILRSSFDSLEEEDQLLFLDVALLLRGHGAGLFWTLCEWLGMVHGKDVEETLECLKRISLVEDFGDDEWDFRMHDLWREFAGAEIKDGKFAGRRLIRKVVSGRVDLTVFPKMEVVRLEVANSGKVALDVRGLKHLKSMAVFPLPYWGDISVLEVNGLGTLKELTYFCCLGVVSSACIAELGCLSNLQVVELIDFGGEELPDMTKLTNLRALILDNSGSLRSVCLRNLTRLTHLELEGCHSLRTVDISGCRSITRLWGLFYSADLEEVDASYCPLLPSLGMPSIHLDSRTLRKLDITGCSSLQELDCVTEMDALEELRATECESLDELPRGCRLPKLRVLEIEPTKVPSDFGCG